MADLQRREETRERGRKVGIDLMPYRDARDRARESRKEYGGLLSTPSLMWDDFVFVSYFAPVFFCSAADFDICFVITLSFSFSLFWFSLLYFVLFISQRERIDWLFYLRPKIITNNRKHKEQWRRGEVYQKIIKKSPFSSSIFLFIYFKNSRSIILFYFKECVFHGIKFDAPNNCSRYMSTIISRRYFRAVVVVVFALHSQSQHWMDAGRNKAQSNRSTI